jgi:transposase InsO family protein
MYKMLFNLISLPIRCIPKIFRNKLLTIAILQKQVEILSRGRSPSAIASRVSWEDRFSLSVVAKLLGKDSDRYSIFSPATLLSWQARLIAARWTYPQFNRPKGRPGIPSDTVDLIRSMKNKNLTWGASRISGELKKIGISVHRSTVARILRKLRKEGKINRTGSWARFLKVNVSSLFATDFFTVDTISGKRLYFLFILELKTRSIVRLAATEFPTREFLKQQMILFSEEVPGEKHLIHDRGGPFCSLDYAMFGIKDVRTSVKAPNMNAYAERFVRSVRRECLDSFLIVNEKQASSLVFEYVDYYNHLRPHQGIGQDVPQGYEPEPCGNIRISPILGGLHHHYYRKAS